MLGLRRHSSAILAGTTALVVAAPIMCVLAAWGQGADADWQHLIHTRLADYIWHSLMIAMGVGAGSLCLGVSTAWLVSRYQFPGSRWLAIALLLPLAVPAYLSAFVYSDLLTYAGPVQSALRAWTGYQAPQEYWFPQLHSVGGAVLILSLALYPYSYLLARTAFLHQAQTLLEAGRTLGLGPWACFWRISVPLARPALVTGAALAVMEALADYGTVQHLGVDTLTVGIAYQWFNHYDLPTAMKLASLLFGTVVLLLTLERLARGHRAFHQLQGAERQANAIPLRGPAAWGTSAWCALPVLLGFVGPAALFAWHALDASHVRTWHELPILVLRSATLAGSAAIVVLIIAAILALAVRLRARSAWLAYSTRLATLGYAVPGSIIAVGLISALGFVDRGVWVPLHAVLDIRPSFLLATSLGALILAYTIRYLAVAHGSLESGLTRIRPSFDAAARTLGQGPWGLVRYIYLPLLRGPMLAALVLVIVDVLKELPATLLMAPSNFQTLAVRVFHYAEDERLAEAGLPALIIIAVGLIPVILLCRNLSRPQSPSHVC